MTTTQSGQSQSGETFVPSSLDKRDTERRERYRRNLAFYDGDHWPGRARGRERRLTFNYAKAAVEKVTSYLMADVRSTVPPIDASPEEQERARRAERLLADIAEANSLDQLDFDTEIDTAVMGDGAYKITWDDERGGIRITAPDVQGLHCWWVGDDVNRIRRVASRYSLDTDEARELHGIRPPARGGSQARVTVTEVWGEKRFQLWAGDTLVRDEANPYGLIPFVVYPNIRAPKQFWGVSDIPAMVEPIRELNRALSQLSTILELSGNPIAVLENVDQSQDIAIQPGAVWELPDRAKAYLLDLLQGGGVQLHIDYVNAIYRTLHDLSETPRIAFGDNRQGLSGVALEMELHPLLHKLRRKRLIRAAAYRKRNEIALRIHEQKTGERLAPYRTAIEWGAILPQDQAQIARQEIELVRSGLRSKRTAMARFGVADPDAELALIDGEQTSSDIGSREDSAAE